ncbi:transcription factor S [Methanobrevibacter sp. DSM 116169]|uniref:transcription factor S n=1 Tax=Methanobrevibacter sp. DSM 116169 TaxID=3242727 RepID=UPI0038FC38EE
MEFCENCGKVLIPKNNKVKCSCGYEKKLSSEDIETQYTFKGEAIPENEVIVKTDNNVTLPTKKITCYKCGGKKGYWWTVQTRSADEAPTYFIRCAKCGNTWRQSN